MTILSQELLKIVPMIPHRSLGARHLYVGWSDSSATPHLHWKGVEESTFTHPVVSNVSAFFLGIDSSAHTTPNDGLCIDEDTVHGVLASTSTTVSDPVMEGLNHSGINIIAGNNIVITGGTAEGNGTHGILIAAGSGVINKELTFIGIDLEGNGTGASTDGYDVQDAGDLNQYYNILATSHCSAGCHSVNLFGGNSDWIIGGQLGDGANNFGANGTGVNGFTVAGQNRPAQLR